MAYENVVEFIRHAAADKAKLAKGFDEDVGVSPLAECREGCRNYTVHLATTTGPVTKPMWYELLM